MSAAAGVVVSTHGGYGKAPHRRTFWEATHWNVEPDGHLHVIGPAQAGAGVRHTIASFAPGGWTSVEHLQHDPSEAEEQAHQLTVAHSAAQTLLTCHETGEIDVSRFPGRDRLDAVADLPNPTADLLDSMGDHGLTLAEIDQALAHPSGLIPLDVERQALLATRAQLQRRDHYLDAMARARALSPHEAMRFMHHLGSGQPVETFDPLAGVRAIAAKHLPA